MVVPSTRDTPIPRRPRPSGPGTRANRRSRRVVERSEGRSTKRPLALTGFADFRRTWAGQPPPLPRTVGGLRGSREGRIGHEDVLAVDGVRGRRGGRVTRPGGVPRTGPGILVRVREPRTLVRGRVGRPGLLRRRTLRG